MSSARTLWCAICKKLANDECVRVHGAFTPHEPDSDVLIEMLGDGDLLTLHKDDPALPSFWEAAKASGMRETRCELCDTPLLTRADVDLCPPCRQALESDVQS